MTTPAQSISGDVKLRSQLTKEEWREYTKTVWQIANVSDPEHPAVFPIEIPRRLIKLFTFVDELVLDPFAGTGTTAAAALALDRRALCIDQSPEYIARMKRDFRGTPRSKVHVRIGDARRLSPQTASIDLIVTSPPYWDKAPYQGNGSNLGNVRNYRDFLDDMGQVFAECARVIRPGRKVCVVTANVNQHTDHGLLTFPLASDFIQLLRTAGLVMVNEIIWSKDGTGGRWGSWGTQRPIFGSYPYPPNFLFKNVHEHILIFAKPPLKPVRGRTVRGYADLMALPAAP